MAFNPTKYLPDDFANLRHIGPSKIEIDEMCKIIGVKNLDELINQTVPKNIRQKESLNFGKAKSERERLRYRRRSHQRTE
jgi:glycine dehydrogenase